MSVSTREGEDHRVDHIEDMVVHTVGLIVDLIVEIDMGDIEGGHMEGEEGIGAEVDLIAAGVGAEGVGAIIQAEAILLGAIPKPAGVEAEVEAGRPVSHLAGTTTPLMTIALVTVIHLLVITHPTGIIPHDPLYPIYTNIYIYTPIYSYIYTPIYLYIYSNIFIYMQTQILLY